MRSGSQNPTQVPCRVSGSTPQHIEPSSQSSTPDSAPPSTVQVPPIGTGSGASGEQREAFHTSPPSFAHGMHFSPAPQSCVDTSHSKKQPVVGPPRPPGKQ